MKSLSNKHAIILISIIIPITAIATIFNVETYVFHPLQNTDNVVVIRPTFTSSAYQTKGFYDYYNSKCGIECLTVTVINETSTYESSKNAIKILEWNHIKIITDLEVHNNPEILSGYKTVILLHNEYVTQNEFDAITSHPNVIYLYPNALYGKVKYEDSKITLIKGHGYPDKEIKNGFEWNNDNSKMEFDTKCIIWNFYKISNGYMLNCYPEHKIKRNIEILEKLDKLLQ